MGTGKDSQTRNALAVLYSFPDGLAYSSSEGGIQIYDKQYYEACRVLAIAGARIPTTKSGVEEFLLEDCFVRLHSEGLKESLRFIQVFSDNRLHIEQLAKRLFLPLPR